MVYLKFLIIFLLILLGSNVIYYCVGKILFYIGVKKFGFRLIAMSLAGDFNAMKKERAWMVKNCPFYDCYNCKLWTCSNYKGKPSNFD